MSDARSVRFNTRTRHVDHTESSRPGLGEPFKEPRYEGGEASEAGLSVSGRKYIKGKRVSISALLPALARYACDDMR